MSSLIPKGFEITAHPIFANYKPPPPPSTASSLSRKRSRSEQNSIETHENQSEKKDKQAVDCPICLEEITDPVTLVVCQHSFCFVCVDHWFKVKESCPLCKEKRVSFVKNKEANKFTEIELWRYSDGRKKLRATDDSVLEAIKVHKNTFQNKTEVNKHVLL